MRLQFLEMKYKYFWGVAQENQHMEISTHEKL